MAPMARRNHWSLRNQRSQRVEVLHLEGVSVGECWACVAVGDGDVWSSPFPISFEFMVSLHVVSTTTSSRSRGLMSSLDEFSDTAAIAAARDTAGVDGF